MSDESWKFLWYSASSLIEWTYTQNDPCTLVGLVYHGFQSADFENFYVYMFTWNLYCLSCCTSIWNCILYSIKLNCVTSSLKKPYPKVILLFKRMTYLHDSEYYLDVSVHQWW